MSLRLQEWWAMQHQQLTLLLAPGCAVTLTNVCITPKEQHQHSTSLLAAGCKAPDIWVLRLQDAAEGHP